MLCPRILAAAGILFLAPACQSRPPAVIELAPASPSAATPPLTEAEIAEVQRTLEDADRAFFRGELRDARARYEKAWERSHPSPLALVMAAHAASALGDASGAESLLRSARGEAVRRPGKVDCPRQSESGVLVDQRGAAWVFADTVNRLDARRRSRLYGFCGAPTREHTRAPLAPVSWAPPFPAASWVRPEGASQLGWNSEHVEIRDLQRGTALARVSHPIAAWDYNEGYGGAIAFSEDRGMMATGANEKDNEVRIWRAADGSLVRALDFRGALRDVHRISFSPDASLLAAADCDGLVIWEVATGKRLAKIRPSQHMQCVYGGGLSDPVERMIFSQDNTLIAVSFFVGGPPTNLPPDDEAGYFVAVFQTRDGKQIRRFHPADSLNDAVAFSADNRALVGFSHVLDLTTGAWRDLEKKSEGGSAATVRWLVAEDEVVEIGPGARVERYAVNDAGLERVGAYWIPKSLSAEAAAAQKKR